jgi:hypothetical protein
LWNLTSKDFPGQHISNEETAKWKVNTNTYGLAPVESAEEPIKGILSSSRAHINRRTSGFIRRCPVPFIGLPINTSDPRKVIERVVGMAIGDVGWEVELGDRDIKFQFAGLDLVQGVTRREAFEEVDDVLAHNVVRQNEAGDILERGNELMYNVVGIDVAEQRD